MDYKRDVLSKFNTPFLKHLLFWGIVFSFHTITAHWAFYRTLQHTLEVYAIMTSLQVIVAYVTIYVLVPKFLDKKKNIIFGLSLLILLILVVTGYHTARYYYLEPTYPQSYATYLQDFGHSTVWERVMTVQVTISKSVFFISPTLLLLMYKFYRDQQRLSKINEQKKTAELTALKHQLNPHFLFNTLNNLYALALKKSDQTPGVIEKLSNILDYMLYRCNDNFVSLQKEIEMIENYLMLEKIRYGKRVNISFEKEVDKEVKIGPLLLLTFIENAFKHGVTQELQEAFISIKIHLHLGQIIFNIENSKSKNGVERDDKSSIGLNNVKKQLELLYAQNYSLWIKDELNNYSVNLKLAAR